MDEQLRVLVVHNFYRIPGGEDVVVSNEIRQLEAHGHFVCFYNRRNEEIDSLPLIRRILLPAHAIFSRRTYTQIKRTIRENRIDVVHVHNTVPLVSPAVYYAARACGVPVVQTVHNFRLVCPGATLYRDGQICEECISKGLWRALKHRCYRGSFTQTAVVVLSSALHRMLGIYGNIQYICLTEFNKRKLMALRQVDPRKVSVKPNFIDGITDCLSEGQRANQYVYVGRLDSIKGIELLLRAWKRLKDEYGGATPRLLVCGTGEMDSWCRAFVADNGLSEVQMLGLVPNERIRRIIAESVALIVPSQWYEGFPMVILEALSCKTPIIGSDVGNVKDLIHAYRAGVCFRHNSIESLADAVLLGESLREYRETMLPPPDAEACYRMLLDIYGQARGAGL